MFLQNGWVHIRPVLWPIVCRSNHRRRGSFPTHTRQNNFCAFRSFPWLLSLSACHFPLSTAHIAERARLLRACRWRRCGVGGQSSGRLFVVAIIAEGAHFPRIPGKTISVLSVYFRGYRHFPLAAFHFPLHTSPRGLGSYARVDGADAG